MPELAEVRIHGVWRWMPVVRRDAETVTIALKMGERTLPIVPTHYANGRTNLVENGAYRVVEG